MSQAFQVGTLSEEECVKIAAVRAERAKRAEERNAKAQDAYRKALAEVGYDETKLIVCPLPDGFGGAAIYKLPAPETWAMVSKRILRALMSDGKKDDMASAVAGLVENAALLIHPILGELQAWRAELPDLYSGIHDVLDARCSHGQSTGK